MARSSGMVVHASRSFDEMERWSREQDQEMTPDQRMAALAELRRQVYGDHPMDVREAERRR